MGGASMEYDAMRMADGPTPNEERIGHLEALLTQARWYVAAYEPTDQSGAYDQTMLLGEIDIAIPPAPALPHVELCSKGERGCCLPKGHEGECCDIPF